MAAKNIGAAQYYVQQADFGGELYAVGTAQITVNLPSPFMPGADRGVMVIGIGTGGFTFAGSTTGNLAFGQDESAMAKPGADGSWYISSSGPVGASAIIASAVTTAIAAAITAARPRVNIVAGATAGDIAITGMLVTSTLISVVNHIGAGTSVTDIADVTSTFTPKAGAMTGTGNTSTGKLLVIWQQ